MKAAHLPPHPVTGITDWAPFLHQPDYLRMSAVREGHDDKKDRHSHLHVRSNGVIYTTAHELLKSPKVRKSIQRTTEIAKKIIERQNRDEEDYE